jgi:hypothetical protein
LRHLIKSSRVLCSIKVAWLSSLLTGTNRMSGRDMASQTHGCNRSRRDCHLVAIMSPDPSPMKLTGRDLIQWHYDIGQALLGLFRRSAISFLGNWPTSIP